MTARVRDERKHRFFTLGRRCGAIYECCKAGERIDASLTLKRPRGEPCIIVQRWRSSMSKVTYNEQTYDFEKIREQFDPAIVEQLAGEYDSDQDFFNTYLVRHHEKFGEQFVVH
jgi:hypothetical protein